MKKTARIAAALAAWFAAAGPALTHADDLQAPEVPLTEAEFADLARDLGQVFSFPVVDYADPYGLTGFDVGAGYLGASLDSGRADWQAVGGPANWSSWYLRAVKGLPFGFDVGGAYGGRLDGDETWWGAELKWGWLEDGVALPAFGVRVAYTQASGIDFADLSTVSAQAELSKGFPFVTPYVGAGYKAAMADPLGGAAPGDLTASIPSAFAGLKIDPLPFLSLTLHADYAFTGAPLLYGAQLSAGL